MIVYCKKCGVRVFSLVDRPSVGKAPSQRPSNQTGLDFELIPHAAIIRAINKIMKCPNCRRMIVRSALVRTEVLFGEWGPTRPEEEKRIEFYV